MKRTTEEYLLIAISFAGLLSVSPFAVIRFLNGEILVGLLDAVLVIGMGSVGIYVAKTRKVAGAGIILGVFSLTGVIIISYLKGPSVIYWAYPTTVGVYFITKPRVAATITIVAGLLIVFSIVNKIEGITLALIIVSLTVTNIFAYMFANRMQDQQQKLSLLVRQDPLTGAGNRLALNDKLNEVIALHNRTKQQTSLIVLDVDHFKSINDTYGHAIGDQVLVRLTELLKKSIRETDSVYRFGGEEFVIILLQTSIDSTTKIAEKIRVLIESSSLVENKAVTVSLGVAEYIDKELAVDWLKRGDDAMYNAKETGRNKTCTSVSEVVII